MILVLSALLGLVLTGLFWWRPAWGVYALVAALPFERIGSWALDPVTGHPVVRLSQIIAAALVVAYSANALFGRVRLRRPSGLLWILAAFNVSAGISALAIGYQALPNGWVALGIMSLLVYVLYCLVLEKALNLHWLFWSLMGSATLVALFGLYQFVAGSLGAPELYTALRPAYDRQVFGFPRVQSTALEPLYFADYLLIPILVGVAAWLGRWAHRRALAVMLAVIASAFVLTMSRGAFLSLGAALVGGGAVVLIWQRGGSWPRLMRQAALASILAALLGLGGVGLATLASQGDFSAGPKKFISLLTTELTTSGSYTERAAMRQTALTIYRDNPWWGVGIEGITPYLSGYEMERFPDDVVALNNQFYELLAETGLIGATLFYMFLAGLLLWAAKTARWMRGPRAAWLAGIGLAVVAITIQAQSFSGFLLTHTWTCYGLLAGLVAWPRPKQTPGGGPLHLVIDARMYGPQRWTGIGRYLQNLIAELEQLDRTNRYTVLLGEDNFDEYIPRSANFRKAKAPYPIYSLSEQWQLWRQLRSLEPDLVHFPSPNAPVLWRGRRVTTIHDLTLLDHNTSRYTGAKRLIGLVKRLVFRGVMWVSVTQSAHVLTPTRYVRDELVRRYGLRARQVSPTPLSVSLSVDRPGDISRFSLANAYILYVGNCYPYKNVGLIVQALGMLDARRPDLQLVVVGREDYFRTQLRRQAAHLGLARQVIFTGQVSDAELAGLYDRASLYVYPSFSEGFGLQGLEAMAHGVPVLAARASCLPETCGEAAAYFDPYDAPALAELIDAVLSDEERRAGMKKAGTAWVRTFSWKRTAEATLEAYRQSTRQ